MIVVTKDDLDVFEVKEWDIISNDARFGAIKQTASDKFVLYREVSHELMEIATFPTLESLQRSLSNIEGIEYVRTS